MTRISLSALLLAVLAGVSPCAPGVAHEGDAIGTFDISAYELSGNTELNPKLVAHLLRRYTGPKRTFSDVEHAVAALEHAFHDRGFALTKVRLPEQELAHGIVRLIVVESKLGAVEIRGNTHHSKKNILASLPGLQHGRDLNTTIVSQNLEQANQNPSKFEELRLQTSTEAGTIDALVTVRDQKPWTVNVTFDNEGLAATGRDQVTTQFQYANLWGLDHTLSLQYTTALEDPHKISVYGVGYHIPLYQLDDSIDVYSSYSNIAAGTINAGLFDLQVSGAGEVYGVRYTHPLSTIGGYSSQLFGGLDHKVFRNSIELDTLQLGGDVTVNPLNFGYQGQWTKGANSANASITAVHNAPAQGAQVENFTAARAQSSPNYSLLRYSGALAHTFSSEWQLRSTFTGQATRDALIPGEQFGLGGETSIRALSVRELSNDRGVSGNLELWTPSLCTRLLGGATRCQALAFVDDGYASRNHALPDEQAHVRVSSAGVGLRVYVTRRATITADYGHVVSASDTSLAGEQRLNLSLGLSF